MGEISGKAVWHARIGKNYENIFWFSNSNSPLFTNTKTLSFTYIFNINSFHGKNYSRKNKRGRWKKKFKIVACLREELHHHLQWLYSIFAEIYIQLIWCDEVDERERKESFKIQISFVESFIKLTSYHSFEWRYISSSFFLLLILLRLYRFN